MSFRSLLSLIRGESVIVSKVDYSRLLDRVIAYERRAAGQRKAAQARAERAKNPEPQT